MTWKLKYETGIAATIQFLLVTALNIINAVTSSLHQCTNGSGTCINNIVLAVLYFLFATIGFGVLWVAGFVAQDRRSKRLAKLLILGELMIVLVALYDLKHQSSMLSMIISAVEGLTAIWVILLATRLLLAKGGRIRPHRRIFHNHHKNN